MNEWRKVKLGEIINILNGYPFKKEDFLESGIPVIKIKNIKSLTVDTEDVQFVNENFYEEKNKYKVNYKDILLSMTGSHISQINSVVGRVGRMKKIGKYLLNQRVAKLISKDKKILNEDFLYYFLSQEEITYQLALSASGSANQANIGNSNIYELIINLPPIFLQEKIAKILSNIDERIELNNKINDNLEKQIALFFDSQFGKYNIIFNENNFSEIPENWEYKMLKDICKQIKPGTNFQPKRLEKGIPFLNIKCITKGYIDTSNASFISKDDYKKIHKNWEPEANDILISRIGTLGLVTTIQKNNLPIAVHYNFINIKSDLLPYEFMYFLFKSEKFQKAYNSIKKQSVQEYVTIDDVSALKIALPKKINLKEFDIYKKIYHLINNLIFENEKLTNLKNYLLPKLMNGEIDVENIEL